jgi:hypothetical protein
LLPKIAVQGQQGNSYKAAGSQVGASLFSRRGIQVCLLPLLAHWVPASPGPLFTGGGVAWVVWQACPLTGLFFQVIESSDLSEETIRMKETVEGE